MLKSARCLKCDSLLRLAPRLPELKLAPRVVDCPSCKTAIDTTLPFRVTWMEALLWKILFVCSIPIVTWLVATRGGSGNDLLVYAAIRVPLIAGLAPFALSKMLGYPLTAILDRSRRNG